jgi:hypothetical protein
MIAYGYAALQHKPACGSLSMAGKGRPMARYCLYLANPVSVRALVPPNASGNQSFFASFCSQKEALASLEMRWR